MAAALVLAAALLMQVATKLQNDVDCTVRGGERSGTRSGLPRAAAEGWLSVRRVRAAIVLASLAAVMGADWVLTGSVGVTSAIASVAIGALAVNNHRDIGHDRGVGRRTLAVTFGERASRRLFGALLVLAFGLVPVLGHVERAFGLLLPLLLVPAAWRLSRGFASCPGGAAFNEVLLATFRLERWFAALLSAGALLTPWTHR